MNTSRHLCPVCHRCVTRTKHHDICGHYDQARGICPGSYRSFDICITDDQPKATA